MGLLVHELDTHEADPLQIARLSVQATVEPIDRDSGEFTAASEDFIGRFPSAEMTLSLADFNLYRLRFGRGRFVAGFAQAYNLDPETFKEIAGLRFGSA